MGFMEYSSQGMILVALAMCGQKETLHCLKRVVVELFNVYFSKFAVICQPLVVPVGNVRMYVL